jgi:Cyclin, N-terminal domain
MCEFLSYGETSPQRLSNESSTLKPAHTSPTTSFSQSTSSDSDSGNLVPISSSNNHKKRRLLQNDTSFNQEIADDEDEKDTVDQPVLKRHKSEPSSKQQDVPSDIIIPQRYRACSDLKDKFIPPIILPNPIPSSSSLPLSFSTATVALTPVVDFQSLCISFSSSSTFPSASASVVASASAAATPELQSRLLSDSKYEPRSAFLTSPGKYDTLAVAITSSHDTTGENEREKENEWNIPLFPIPQHPFEMYWHLNSRMILPYESSTTISSMIVDVKSLNTLSLEITPKVPLENTTIEEEYQEKYEMMISREQKYTIKGQYLTSNTSPTISKNMRYILCSWLLEWGGEVFFLRETLHRAIQLLDRFFECEYIPSSNTFKSHSLKSLTDHHKYDNLTVNRSTLQIIGCACMWIAAKFIEDDPPRLDEVSYVIEHASKAEEYQIRQWETIILESLGFQLHTVTCDEWTRFYYSKLLFICRQKEVNSPIFRWLLHTFRQPYLWQLIGFYTDLTHLFTSLYLQYVPSILSIGCICRAFLDIYPHKSQCLVKYSSMLFGTQWNIIAPIIHSLENTLSQSQKTDLFSELSINGILENIREKWCSKQLNLYKQRQLLRKNRYFDPKSHTDLEIESQEEFAQHSPHQFYQEAQFSILLPNPTLTKFILSKSDDADTL